MNVTVLAGGVGAARFLRGLVQVVDPTSITVVANTGDDVVLHGLHISPDLDTITYTLAGAIDPERGWGLAGETWQAMDGLRRYGGIDWFNLGDRDLATHLHRTQRLRDGAGLAEVTGEIARAWGLTLRLLPVTEDELRTMVTVVDEGEIGFQEYFVRRRHDVEVTAVRVAGASSARPAPGVLDAIGSADVVVVAPSNPLVSIGPLLAVPGVREAIEAVRGRTVAISPIVGGAALKGPADRMLRELGHDASATGVARLYKDLAAVLVVDERDRDLQAAVEAEGVRAVVTDTVMSDPEVSARLARTVLDAVQVGR
ncbi:2-phospho-L-lactate transferase [Actinomarinicola tropica]|uniref:2-phospho-L-lactate transferase n=1 Tax=Actinomarinicola tropica TaxID=2789776 RepID=A0A5Q2RG71_9ACTN|nr:2-phospho-L-lactate transferase [Actinomarinicola tropica]QGG95819.1 2-phospho-L-lactate transferase [Actinomarinicola tropica]